MWVSFSFFSDLLESKSSESNPKNASNVNMYTMSQNNVLSQHAHQKNMRPSIVNQTNPSNDNCFSFFYSWDSYFIIHWIDLCTYSRTDMQTGPSIIQQTNIDSKFILGRISKYIIFFYKFLISDAILAPTLSQNHNQLFTTLLTSSNVIGINFILYW